MTIQNIPYGDRAAGGIYNKPNKAEKSDGAAKKDTVSFSDQYKKAVRTQKTDTWELSGQNTTPTLSQIRDSLVSDLSQDKDPGVLEALRSRLESGSYVIDSGEIAAGILSAGNRRD